MPEPFPVPPAAAASPRVDAAVSFVASFDAIAPEIMESIGVGHCDTCSFQSRKCKPDLLMFLCLNVAFCKGSLSKSCAAI